jgi:hypothetical protein
MVIDRLGKELEALGVSGRDARCLLLLPQVYVGWASQRRNPAALEALLDVTARSAPFDRHGVDAARGWLFEAPTRAQFQSGFALLRVLRKSEDSGIGSSEMLEAMIWASRAAELDRAPTPRGRGPVSQAARRALADLEAWLELDFSDLWDDVLADDVPADDARADDARADDVEPAPSVAQETFPAFDAPPRAEPPPFAGRKSGTALRTQPEPTQPEVSYEPGTPPSAPFPLVRRLG